MLGLDDLHYYDLYAPLAKSVNTKYSVEEAENQILEALAPLGPEYAWIDFYPADGKASGGRTYPRAYDVHPYILLNYSGQYNDMSALAHELGHSMQTYFSDKVQPYPLSDYPIFIAEVASTFNETMLVEHVIQTISDKNTKLSLLGNYLENIRTTVFRQAQFAHARNG